MTQDIQKTNNKRTGTNSTLFMSNYVKHKWTKHSNQKADIGRIEFKMIQFYGVYETYTLDLKTHID